MHEAAYPRRSPDGTPRGAWFTTLTYSPENVPQNGSLDPEGVRQFLARLRKRFPPRTLSYYLCGEYGEKSDRPHYHAVFFGPQFLARDLRTHRHGAPVWVAQALQDAWGLGHTELTPLRPGAALYTAGYVRKKVRQKDDPGHYTRVDRETGELVELEMEFGRMSKRPAVGRRWLEEFWRDVYPRDFVVLEGKPQKPPRYYDKLMEELAPEIMEEVRYQRWQDSVNIGDDKLIMAEKVHRARVNLFNPRGAV